MVENAVIHRQYRWGVFPTDLMNGNSILRPHLVKLINADNSIVGQHHGPSLHAYIQLSSAWDLACMTHPCPCTLTRQEAAFCWQCYSPRRSRQHRALCWAEDKKTIINPTKSPGSPGSMSGLSSSSSLASAQATMIGAPAINKLVHHSCSARSVQVSCMMHEDYASRAVPQGRTPHCCPSPQWL